MSVVIPKLKKPKDCNECWTKYRGFGMVEHDEDTGVFYCQIAHGYCADWRTICPVYESDEGER